MYVESFDREHAMIDDLNTSLVLTRRDDVIREATASRLARIAPACRQSRVRASLDSLTHWLRAGQLGNGYVDAPACPLTARCTGGPCGGSAAGPASRPAPRPP